MSIKHPIKNSNKSKILIVDDEERILNSLKSLFRMDYDVTTTTDGYEALRLLKESEYNLIISDQRMPIMKGVDLLVQAKEVSPNTIRVLLTGFSDLADLIGSVNDGEIFRFISKPWDNDEIASIVNEGVNISIALAAEQYRQTLDSSEPIAEREDSNIEQLICFASKHIATKGMDDIDFVDKIGKYKNPASPIVKNESVLTINIDDNMFDFISATLPNCVLYRAKNHDHAIKILSEHEIAVIVSIMDGDHTLDAEFFSTLKKEQPQIISIVIGPSGDANALTQLINYARVFRYMFKPMKPSLLGVYLNSALEEYEKLKKSPARLKVQSTFKPEDESVVPVSKGFLSAIKSLKRFF